MLMRIDKDRYINADRILAIIPHTVASTPENTAYVILLSERLQVTVPESVVNYITQSAGVDDAIVLEPPQESSLISRLAVYLRDSATGATWNMLEEYFENTGSTDLQAAVNELLANNTVKVQYASDEGPRFYYASTFPVPSNASVNAGW